MQEANRTKKTTQRHRKNLKQKQRQKFIRTFKAGKANNASRSGSRFYPVVPSGFYSIDNTSTHSHDYEFMLDELKPTYFNYCKLSKVKAKALSGTPTFDLRKMVNHLTEIIHSQYKKSNLRIQKTETGYQFEVYSRVESARNDQLCVFSLLLFEKINFLSRYFSEVFESFMASMFHRVGINYYTDNYRFDSLLYEIDQRENYEEGEDGEMEFQREMLCYLKFAPLYIKRMRKVGDMFTDPKFKNQIVELNTRGNTELMNLREWMIEGFNLMTDKNCKDIRNFQYDNEIAEEYNDDHAPEDAVKLEDLFVVTWDYMDSTTNQYIEWLNSDSGEYGNYTPCEWTILRPTDTCIYEHSKWGEDFFKWIDNGFKIFNQFDSRQ